MSVLDQQEEARRQEVTEQLTMLFEATAADEAGDEVDWQEQHMLVQCLMEARRGIMENQNALQMRDFVRRRYPFLYSRRRKGSTSRAGQGDDGKPVAEAGELNEVEENEVEENEVEENEVETNEVETNEVEANSPRTEEPPSERPAPEDGLANTSNSPTGSSEKSNNNDQMEEDEAHSKDHDEQHRAGGGAPSVPDEARSSSVGSDRDKPMSTVFNIESMEGAGRATFMSEAATEQWTRSFHPAPQNQALVTSNLMVWHRCTEIPFDISSSEFTVKTPVLPLVQGGHLVFLTSRCGKRKWNYSVKIIKKSHGSSTGGLSAARARRRQETTALSGQQAVINKDEFLVLKKLAHPCVATLLYFCENMALYYYFFPHYKFASLSSSFSLYNQLGANACVYITCCMINAVEYLYRNCVIHRDISGKSVLFNPEGRPVLFHFDYATFHGSLRCSEARATFLPELASRAPEVISPEIYKTCKPEYYVNCDVWGIGVLLGELLLSTIVMARALKRKLDLHWVFSVRESDHGGMYFGVPRDLIELLRMCLRKHAQDRPSVHSLMQNALFAKYNVASIHNVIYLKVPITGMLTKSMGLD